MLVLVHFTVFYFQFLLSCYIRAYEVLSFLSHCASLSFQPFFGISFWCPIVFLIVRSPKMLLTHSSFSCENQKSWSPFSANKSASLRIVHTHTLSHPLSLSFFLACTHTTHGVGFWPLRLADLKWAVQPPSRQRSGSNAIGRKIPRRTEQRPASVKTLTGAAVDERGWACLTACSLAYTYVSVWMFLSWGSAFCRARVAEVIFILTKLVCMMAAAAAARMDVFFLLYSSS